MGITQPAASRLLGELERLSEAQLYQRHARGVRLTDAGAHFATKARAMLHLLDDTHSEIRALSSGTRGAVRIGAVTGSGAGSAAAGAARGAADHAADHPLGAGRYL